MICNGCVFHKVIKERGQDVCALHDDIVEGIKECCKADYFVHCDKRMDRGDIVRLVKKNEQAARERDSARELLELVQRVIDGMLKEGGADAEKV